MKESSLSKKFTDFDESSTLWSGEREEKESQMPDFELNYRYIERFEKVRFSKKNEKGSV